MKKQYYLFLVHKESKTLVFRTPKCANSSLATSLLSYGFEECEGTDISQYEDYYKIAVVRDPIIRRVSAFFTANNTTCFKSNKQAYDLFVRQLNDSLIGVYVPQFQTFKNVDKFFTLENIETDWSYLCERVGIDIPLVKVNVNYNQERKSYIISKLTSELVNKIENIYIDDVKLYEEIINAWYSMY